MEAIRARGALRRQWEKLERVGAGGQGRCCLPKWNTLATLPWIQGVREAIWRTCWLRGHPVCVPACLHPLAAAWLLGFRRRPSECPRSPTCTARWSGYPAAPRCAFPTAPACGAPGSSSLLPSAPETATQVGPSGRRRGRRRQPRGWPVVVGKPAQAVAGPRAEAGDQGLQQVSRLGKVGCSPSPDLFRHSHPPRSVLAARTPLTSTSGRSKGWLVRGGEVSPRGRRAAGESKRLRWPDVRASVGGPSVGTDGAAASGVWGGGPRGASRASRGGAPGPPLPRPAGHA